MLPLLSRIFESLNKPVEGTDDVIEQTSMRKAYLSFILNLFTNRMEAVFVSEGWLLVSNGQLICSEPL
jgi:hypothetical protein